MIAIRFMSRFSVTDFYFAPWNVIWVDAEVIPEKIKLIKINNWWFSAGLMQPMICHFLCLSKQASFSITKYLPTHSFKITVSSTCDSEAHLELSQTSEIELFVKSLNNWKPLTISIKSSILDVWLGAEYVSALFFLCYNN